MKWELGELQENLRGFCQESMEWCARESEQSTDRVMKAIEELLKNTVRVSQISAESLLAIQGLQSAIRIKVEDKTKEGLDSLVKSLKELANEHNDVQNVIHPIIQALQYQDRLRQNLENNIKMLKVWIDTRERLGPAITQDEMIEFGRNLAKCTTTVAERDIIRAHIDGMEAEPDVDAVMMF